MTRRSHASEITQLENLARQVRTMAAFARAGLKAPNAQWDFSRSSEAMIAAALEASRQSGAPVAGALDSCARVCSALVEHLRSVGAVLAGPRLARRIILVMPVIAVVLTSALGFDVLTVLLGSAFGWMLVAVATALTWAGSRWSNRLIRAAAKLDVTAGLHPRLLSIALGSGVGATRAREVVAQSLARSRLAASEPEVSLCDELFRAASRSGIPLRLSLIALDESLMADELSRARGRANELGEKLLLPLGCCALPAFLCVGVVPAVISVASATAGLS